MGDERLARDRRVTRGKLPPGQQRKSEWDRREFHHEGHEDRSTDSEYLTADCTDGFLDFGFPFPARWFYPDRIREIRG